MVERTLNIESQMRLGVRWSVLSSEFFESYSKVPAFAKRNRKPNGAIALFDESRSLLEARIKSLDEIESRFQVSKDDSMATANALLALVYWLFPDHSRYDRQKVASMMLKHSTLAMSASTERISPNNCVALFVQLRVLSFLVRSKKVDMGEIAKKRESAKALLESFDQRSSVGYLESPSHGDVALFRGMIYDGLAFSHYQLERDNQMVLSLLDASVKSFAEASKVSRRRDANPLDSSVLKAKNYFCNSMAAVAYWDYGLCYESLAENLEGEEKLSYSRLARSKYEKSYRVARSTTWDIYKGLGAYSIAGTYARESESVSDRRTIHDLLKKSVSFGEEGLKAMSRWSTYESDFLGGSMIAGFYQRLAEYSPSSQRKRCIKRSLELAKRAVDLLQKLGSKSARYSQAQIGDIFYGNANYYRQTAMDQRTITSAYNLTRRVEDKKIIEPLNRALEYCLKSKPFYIEERHNKRAVDACLLAGEVCNELMNCNIEDTERVRIAGLAKRQCREAMKISNRMGWNERVGESNWALAQILDREGHYESSSSSFMTASVAYVRAGRASASAKRIFEEFEQYMRSLSRIELAKTLHRKSRFMNASSSYLEASRLVSQTKRWHELSTLFSAESLIEKAESDSLADKSQMAIDLFNEAISELAKFLSFKQILAEDSAEHRFASQLVAFCKARVILERSKESYRTGEIEQSVKRLSSAETLFQELSSSPLSDATQSNELDSMSSLCAALRSFQTAQIKSDPGLYLEAKQIFGDAAKTSRSKSLRLLLSGLAGFAAFLFLSSEIERSLEASFSVDKLVECNRALENSESNFRRLGNKSFLNMLRASKHILNATITMSAAEREMERPDEKAKLYSKAQRSLHLASNYYKMIGSSRRVNEAIRMISAVRNHRRLIPLARDIIAEVASNQIIYSAIANSSLIDQPQFESSRTHETAYIALDCDVDNPYVDSGGSCMVRFSITNAGHEPISAVKIDESIPEEFEVESSTFPLMAGHSLKLNLKVDPGMTRQLSLSYKAVVSGNFVWHPSLVYIDSSKSYRIARSQPVRAVVEQSSAKDFASLFSKKAKLESELTSLTNQKESMTLPSSEPTNIEEKVYSLKEQISGIEEEFLRTKNEYLQMQKDLTRVQTDLNLLGRNEDRLTVAEDRADLEAEEKLLKAKIDRRRSLLEQARML